MDAVCVVASFLDLGGETQGTLDTARKFAAGENKSSHRGHMNMKKLDDETEEFQREWSCGRGGGAPCSISR